MSNTMFESTYMANQEITKVFDMAWALEAGLWNLRIVVQKYYLNHPDATNEEVTEALVQGLRIHGLNPKRIATELNWEYEEQYIAKLLLINATAIFDTWVDEFVEATISQKVLRKKFRPKQLYTLGDKIKADLKSGKFSTYENKLSLEEKTSLYGCFRYTAHKQDTYLNNLRLVYKYFKSCRNCCVHGSTNFTFATERDYNAIKLLTADACGIKEFPKIESTVEGAPFKLYLRGVVGFYDILIRIINHYDLLAADHIAVENELLKRLELIPNIQLAVQNCGSRLQDCCCTPRNDP